MHLLKEVSENVWTYLNDHRYLPFPIAMCFREDSLYSQQVVLKAFQNHHNMARVYKYIAPTLEVLNKRQA